MLSQHPRLNIPNCHVAHAPESEPESSPPDSPISIDSDNNGSRPAAITDQSGNLKGTLYGPLEHREATAARMARLLKTMPEYLEAMQNKITQKSIAENMTQLDQLRKKAKLGCRTTTGFSFEFAYGHLKKKMSMAELINLLIRIARPESHKTFGSPQGPDIGRFVSDTINTFQQAFTQVVSGTKEEYKLLLELVTAETKEELEKTTPEIRDLCANIRKSIGDRIEALPSAVEPDALSIQVINGMFFWHQWIMGISMHPERVSFDEELKEIILELMPTPETRERMEYLLYRFENNCKDRVLETDSNYAPIFDFEGFKQHIFMLFHGLPGLGKTYLGNLLMRLYDKGRRSVSLPPSTEYFIRPWKLNPDVENDDKVWLMSPKEVLGPVAELLALGYLLFQLEEAEKYFLPQDTKITKNKPMDESVPTELKSDGDTSTTVVRLPLGGFKVPIPLDTALFVFTTNVDFRSVYAATYPELFRRFQLAVEFKTATEKSLLSAYQDGLNKAFTLTKNTRLRAAVKEKLDEYGIGELIIKVGKSHSSLSIPHYVSVVTETVVGNIVKRLDMQRVLAKDAGMRMDSEKQNVLKSIDGQWKNLSVGLKSQPLIFPGRYGAPPLRPGMPNISAETENEISAVAIAGRRERKSARAICLDKLFECVKNDNDSKESARITEAFRTHDTVNKIVDMFKGGGRDDGDDSASEPEEAAGFFDRQILKDAVGAAYESFKGENAENVAKAIKKVFSKAEEFSESPDEVRSVVNGELKKCYEGLDPAMKLELDMLLFKHDPIAKILNWFHTFRFATPNVLQDAARAVYQHFVDYKNDFEKKKSEEIDQEIEDVIEAAFAPWRKLNGENPNKPRPEIIKMPLYNDLREDSAEKGDLIEKFRMKVVISDPNNKNISYTGEADLDYDPPPSPSERDSDYSDQDS